MKITYKDEVLYKEENFTPPIFHDMKVRAAGRIADATIRNLVIKTFEF